MLFGHIKLDNNILYKVKKVLEKHFKIEIEIPKVLFVSNPQRFFNYYVGVKKHRTRRELIELSCDVQYFYDQTTKTIIFRGFRRNGTSSFKIVRDEGVSLGELVHEFIHHIQFEYGNYGDYDFFEEACNELCRFVIIGDVKIYSDYFQYIIRLWNLLDCVTKDPKKKYNLIRDYNISPKKKQIHNRWLNKFLKRYPNAAKNIPELIAMLEDHQQPSPTVSKELFQKISNKELVEEIYKLRDIYKSSFPHVLFK